MRDRLLDSNGTKISMSTTDGGLNVLKSMEKRSRHSELSVTSQVSTVEGCLLNWVPLYFTCPNGDTSVYLFNSCPMHST